MRRRAATCRRRRASRRWLGFVTERRGRLVCVALLAAGFDAHVLLHAQALAPPGHVFTTTFATSGSAEGQPQHPSDVAIDEASGLAYVSDTGNDRVEVFKPRPRRQLRIRLAVQGPRPRPDRGR